MSRFETTFSIDHLFLVDDRLLFSITVEMGYQSFIRCSIRSTLGVLFLVSIQFLELPFTNWSILELRRNLISS